MYTCALQSGSNGNCIYVETDDARLLFDAGISGRQADQRLSEHDRDIRNVDALLLSHGHSDHVSAAGVFHRRFGLPIYATPPAWRACSGKLGIVRDVQHFDPGEDICFGATRVQTIPTAHDGAGGVAFIVHAEDRQLGIFTDLGHAWAGIEAHLQTLDAVYIESNYDPQMLEDGPYPIWLKRRITGAGGHLSNGEAVELIRASAPQAKLVILSHLSEHNNCPDLALATADDALSENISIAVAPRTNVSRLFQI